MFLIGKENKSNFLPPCNQRGFDLESLVFLFVSNIFVLVFSRLVSYISISDNSPKNNFFHLPTTRYFIVTDIIARPAALNKVNFRLLCAQL